MLFPVALAIFGLSSTAFAAGTPQFLGADDLIVLKDDDTMQVMKAAEFEAINNAASAPALVNPEFQNMTGAPATPRRRCDESTEVQILSDEEFLDWDTAISPVVSSPEGGEVRVSVASGYSVANAVGTGISATGNIFGMIAAAPVNILSLQLSVTYTQTWTTTQDQSQIFLVPEGHYGVVISQPYVRRVQGNVFSGCTDSPEKTPFVSDTYSSQSYGNLQWVKGVIRLCSSETYPIPYCNGEGEHK